MALPLTVTQAQGPLKRLWHKVSNLGIEHAQLLAHQRKLIMGNRMATLIGLIALGVFLGEVFFKSDLNRPNGLWVTGRMLLVVLVNAGFLYSNYKGYWHLTRAAFILTNAFLGLLFPLMFGRLVEDMLLWFPFLATAYSFMAHIIYDARQQKGLYYFNLAFFLVLVALSPDLLFWLSNDHAQSNLALAVQRNYPFYKIASLAFFLFINLGIMYVLTLNRRFERAMQEAELSIRNKNKVIVNQSGKLEKLNIELRVQHEQLKTFNKALEEQVRTRSNKLAKQNKHLRALAYVHAYQVRPPVSRIQGLVNLLRASNETIAMLENQEEHREVLERLIVSAQELAQVMASIRQKMDQGQIITRHSIAANGEATQEVGE